MEGLGQAGVVIGSVLTSWLISVFGIEASLVVMGGFAPAVAALLWSPLTSIERGAPVPDAEALALLRSMPMFTALSPPTLERLALDAIPLEVPGSTEVVRQGDEGDRYFAIADGVLDVSRNGSHVAELGRGDGVGEIALLDDVPRTATVTVRSDARLYSLTKEPFLLALTGHPPADRAARRVASDRRDRLMQLDAG
jgi:hypothetical protein